MNVNKFDNYHVSFINIKILTKINKIRIRSIELINSAFTNLNNVAIISDKFNSDSFSLESLSSIRTEKLELSQDQAISKKIDVFVIKRNNYHIFSQDNPQVVIYNNLNSDIIFGTNYIDFNNFKIISQVYPFIEIENTAQQLNFLCHSNLIQSVLLTPIIHMSSGKCTFYGSKWPQLPKKINSYWELGTFYETKEREILVILESASSICLHGNKIPISIKSNECLTIFCDEQECGILGKIYTQTSNDNILLSIKKKVTLYVSEIVNLTDFAKLNSKSSDIQIVVETCRTSFTLAGLSNYMCNSIDNELGQFTPSNINLAPNGNFVYYLKLNTNLIINRLKRIINFGPLGNIYDNKGNLNITAILEYAENTLTIDSSSALSIISTLKSFGNSLIGIDFVTTKGKHNLRVKRSDVMYSLFYYNVHKYNKYLVCSKNQFDLNDWSIQFDDFTPNNLNVPFFDFTETNIAYTTRNYANNETTYCLQMKINEYPNSAVEFLFHTNNPKLEGKFTWISGIFANFVTDKKLSNIKSSLSNGKSKNIVFVTLNDLKTVMNANKIRNDANLLIIGASLSILDELKKGLNAIDFDIIRPNVKISYSSLNSVGYLLCKINEVNVNAKNFIALASDIVNKDEFTVSARDVVFDLSTWKQIEKNGNNYKFKNFVLLPFELKPEIHYLSIQKVEFLRDRWKIHFANSSCEVLYSTVSERFLIMTGANKVLNLTIDESFKSENGKTVLKPVEIGYNVAFEKKLSNFPGIPLLSEQKDPTFSEPKDGFNLNFYEIIKSTFSKHMKEEETSEDECENVIFEGDWNQIKDFSGKLVYSSDKANLKVTNFPLNHFNKIEFSSKQKIEIENVISDQLNSKAQMKRTSPLIINGRRELIIPSNTDIDFENITVSIQGSSFNFTHNDHFAQNLIRTRHFRAAAGSASHFDAISVSDSIELEPNTYTIFESATFSNNLKINYDFSFEKRFPLLVINNNDAVLNSIVLHDISNKKLTVEKVSDDLNLMPQFILKKSTKENECEKLSKIFTFENSNDLISLFCQFDTGDMTSYTSFGLNLTVIVNEGGIDYDGLENKSDKKNAIIISSSIIGGVLFVCVVAVVVFFIVKCNKEKNVRNDESIEPLTSDNLQPLNSKDVLLDSSN